ncbi:MAG: deoxyribose-phosphate aldolase [Cytophagales bacterium]|nr:MAG: deoxyribose-phosphate aldolase [Cytophagales bacterium]
MQQPIQNYIEHTLLRPDISDKDIENLIDEAIKYQFVGVCVPPYWAKKARRDIGKNPIQLVTVVGFPLGYSRSEVKLKEIESALREGVNELDVVVNISAIKTGMYGWVKAEIAQFAKMIHEQESFLKVILETAYLNPQELEQTAKVCIDAGADYLKTSTGFAPTGAEISTVQRLRSLAPSHVGIKASGGIKTLTQTEAFIEAGAERIGTSASIAIMEQWQEKIKHS